MPEQTVPTEPDPRSRAEAAIGQTLATLDDVYAAIGSIARATQRSSVRGAVVWANVSLIKALRFVTGDDRDDDATDDLAERVRRMEGEVSVHSEALAGLMRAVYIEGGQS